MKLRWMLILGVPLLVTAILAATVAADVPSGAPTAPAVPPYKVYLPAVSRCYPRPSTDPLFYQQGDMSVIHADQAWTSCSGGSNNVMAAVIDTGGDLDHPDLMPNAVWGYDFVDGDWTPQDGNGHGTNVAGIVGAALNGIGVSGVAPYTRILIVRVLDDNGAGYTSDVANGIIYATQAGAKAINLSLGSVYYSSALANAVNYATANNRLVVAAAGNCGDAYYYYNGCSYQNQTVYPGALSNVLAVAATNNSDAHASFSNVGSYVDVSAPGVYIYNLSLNGYANPSGTSQAAPHVTGLAALIWSYNPNYSYTQVWNRIISTAVDLGTAGWDATFGYGRIDVKAALGFTTLNTMEQPTADRVAAPTPVTDRRAEIAPGRVLVKFKAARDAAGIDRALGDLKDVTVARTIEAIDALVLSVPVGEEWTVADNLGAQAEVEYAEPDFVVRVSPIK